MEYHVVVNNDRLFFRILLRLKGYFKIGKCQKRGEWIVMSRPGFLGKMSDIGQIGNMGEKSLNEIGSPRFTNIFSKLVYLVRCLILDKLETWVRNH